MSVLVTGGAGYIGSHTVRLLRSQGRDVVVEGGRAKVVDPSSAGPPDVTVAMDSETFLVLAVGRQTAAERSDRIEISGEGDWGQAVVEQLNMMI